MNQWSLKHTTAHVLSEVWFFHLGVNVVFSARQNHLVKLKTQHWFSSSGGNDFSRRNLSSSRWALRSQLTAGFPGRVTGVDTQTAVTTNGYDYYSRDLGVAAITALWDSIDLLLDPLLGSESVDSSLKPAFLPVHHVDLWACSQRRQRRPWMSNTGFSQWKHCV